MPMHFKTAVTSYLRDANPSRGTRKEYSSTLRKWFNWGNDLSIEELTPQHIREFLDWVFEQAVAESGTNPGRTANKARENLRAIMSWAWEHELVEALPRFPKPRPYRKVAGRHYLTKAEINALYFATHKMRRPRGWDQPIPVGRYWRSALVVFFNYGLDTGTIWGYEPHHEPILWRHVSWKRESPTRENKQRSRWGWLYYKRVKTGKTFYRPMNRSVHVHIRSLMPRNPDPDSPVFLGGGSRPYRRFAHLCDLANLQPRTDCETGEEKRWLLKDLRKTCATYYDEHVPESSIEILGHSVGGVTYRHYAHRAPLAFRAIMTLPQPSAFAAMANGFDHQCPCCRRDFLDGH
ncbi:phage integrase N-terminal SAM-like domain-containing protein [Pirellulales bacterium]|nr:phage integrase N-terminal SAM-like domain-containing protein [Pirellulales bacterium]